MDINIFDDRKNNNYAVSVIADDPVMRELIIALVSPFAAVCDKNPDLCVVCAEKEPRETEGGCIFIGKGPKSLKASQVTLSRPLDISEFTSTLREMLKKRRSYEKGSWSADAVRRAAILEGKEVILTKRELELYLLLLSRADECVSREEIEASLWQSGCEGNCCDVYICYLRKKLESISAPGVLISVRGQGYMLKKP